MESSPKRILVPTDFSPASDCAIHLASKLASSFEAEIHLLHVRTMVDNPVVCPEDLEEVERILAMSDVETRKTLEKSAEEIDVLTQCHATRGAAPAGAILDAVSEYHCDLVIMGTNGRRGLKNLLVGSVAKEVVHRSPVPVLTTRAGTGRGFPPKKILVAFDSSEDSLRAVQLAAEWAQLLAAEVTVLHAVEPVTYPSFYAHYAVDGKYLDQISTQCREALAEVAKEHLSAVTHETAVIHARAAEGITEFALSHDFDLVVLATRGLSGIAHTLFGSVAERVTQTSEVPVLTVREPPRAPRQKPKRAKKSTTSQRRLHPNRDRGPSFSVERTPERTVLRFLPRDSLAGADLHLLHGLWDFFEKERREPSRVLVVLVPPGLLSPQSLERLLGGTDGASSLTATEISDRIIREENVIQRFIENVRELETFVVGVVDGEIAFQLAAPLLACDYRIVSSGSVFVNTTQALPRAPLAGLPWLLAKLVGGARASQLLLDVPRLSAEEASELGLVTHVAEPDQLEAGALEVADRLGSLPRATLISLKRAIIASSEDFQAYQQKELALTHHLASAHYRE